MSLSTSFWERDTYLQNFDFAVLGNGITGMQVALQIRAKFPNASIAIIDKSNVSGGASMRNAGFACFGSVSEILDDIHSQESQLVFDLVNMRYQGLKHLQADFHNIDYHQGNALEVFLPKEQSQLNECIDKIDFVNQEMKSITGKIQTYKLTQHQFGKKFLNQAISNELEGHLHTGKLYHKMQQKVVAHNIFWVSGIEITNVERGNAGWTILNTSKLQINALVAVSCLNAFTNQLIVNAPIYPARGQIIVTNDLAKNPLKGILHADKGYIYARPLGNKILIGGARNLDFETENTHDFAENIVITKALIDFVNENLLQNEQAQIAQTWSCIMAMSPQKGGLPIIKEHQKDFWLCYRLGGMGVALSAMLARDLAAQL